MQLIAAVFPEDRGVTAESNAAVSAAVAAVIVADKLSATEEVGAAAASCELRPALEVEITGSPSEGLPGLVHKAKLPLLRSILLAGHAHGTGTHLIYSNLHTNLNSNPNPKPQP